MKPLIQPNPTIPRSPGQKGKRRRPSSSPAISDKGHDFSTTRERRPSSSGSCRNTLSSPKKRPLWNSTRLDRLATPRRSSSWKKPIHSKYSQGRRRSSGDELSPTKSKSDKVFRSHLSPRLRNLIKSITPGTAVDPPGTKSKDEHDKCEEYDESIWQIDDDAAFTRSASCEGEGEDQTNHAGNFELAELGNHANRFDEKLAIGTTDPTASILARPVIASVINHAFHLSCPPASVVKYTVLQLQGEIQRLTNELATKGQYIFELERKLRDSKGRQEEEIPRRHTIGSCSYDEGSKSSISLARKQTSTSPSNEELEGSRQHLKELAIRLSSDLDSMIFEMNEMKVEHEHEMERVRKSSACPRLRSLDSGKEGLHRVEEMVSSLSKLKKGCRKLRRSSVESIHLANSELEKNCEKIRSYVREEVESVRRGEVQAANHLRSELKAARSENLELAGRMIRMREASKIREWFMLDRVDTISSKAAEMPTPNEAESEEKMTATSPLATSESWFQFCWRFREALNVSTVIPDPKDGLNHNSLLRADKLFKEVSFGINSSEQNEDMFVDALD